MKKIIVSLCCSVSITGEAVMTGKNANENVLLPKVGDVKLR